MDEKYTLIEIDCSFMKDTINHFQVKYLLDVSNINLIWLKIILIRK